MKRCFPVLAAGFVILSLAGCGSSFDPSVSSIYIQPDGKVTQAIIGSFEQAYYSMDEFQSMVEKEVAAYNAAHGEGKVEIDRMDVKDDTMHLLLEYEDADTYEQYNEKFCFTGTVEDALNEGFPFDMDFRGPDYADYTLEEATADQSDSIVVLKEEGVVQLEKAAKYVSNNVEYLSDNMVEVMPIEAENEYAYIIY